MATRGTSNRGFAAMDKNRQKEIAKKGGIASGKSRSMASKARASEVMKLNAKKQ